jgi:hypothetical protein
MRSGSRSYLRSWQGSGRNTGPAGQQGMALGVQLSGSSGSVSVSGRCGLVPGHACGLCATCWAVLGHPLLVRRAGHRYVFAWLERQHQHVWCSMLLVLCYFRSLAFAGVWKQMIGLFILRWCVTGCLSPGRSTAVGGQRGQHVLASEPNLLVLVLTSTHVWFQRCLQAHSQAPCHWAWLLPGQLVRFWVLAFWFMHLARGFAKLCFVSASWALQAEISQMHQAC